jgi:hypothetical protein
MIHTKLDESIGQPKFAADAKKIVNVEQRKKSLPPGFSRQLKNLCLKLEKTAF